MIGKIVYLNEKSEELEIKEIDINLENLHALLNGGYLENAVISEKLFENNIHVLIDEEGKIKDLKPKIIILDKDLNIIDVIVGSVIFIGTDLSIGDFCGLNNKQINLIYEIFKNKLIQIKLSDNSCKKIHMINY